MLKKDNDIDIERKKERQWHNAI